MKRVFHISLFVLVALLCSAQGTAVLANQYRSVATGNWGAAGTWQISTDGGTTWATATNYPGQTTLNDTVLIRNGHTVTLNVSPANAIGRLTVGEGMGGALSIGGQTITVSGTLTVNSGATVTVTSTTGTKSFGNVVLNSGATWTSNAGETYTISGNLTLGGASIGGTGTGIFNVGADLLVSGTNSIAAATFSVTGSTVVNGSWTFSSTTGTKTFNNVTINSGGSWNSTAAETYAINGTLTMNGGTIGGTATGVFNITGDLDVPSGTNSIERSTITVNGTTNVSGTLQFTNATGTKTFVGTVTITSGGTWNNSSNQAIVLRGGIQNDGTFISGTGTYTFNTNNQTISGTSGLTFSGAVAITGAITVTNQTTVTISGNLTGSVAGSTWLNDINSTLNAGGAVLTTGTLNAAAVPNLVNYNGTGAQTIKATNYNNLTISGARGGNNVTFPNGGTVGISGSFTPSATFTTGNYVTTGNTINFNGSGSQTIPALGTANYNNLTRSGTGTATLDATIGIAGNLTISGGTLDLSTFTANRTTAGGTLTLGAGATLRIGGTNSLPANYSTHSIAATSTIEYYGGNQTVAVLNSGQNYGNLTISGTGTKTLAGTIGVAGNLTVAASTLDLGTFTANRTSTGGTLTVASGATLRIGGTGTLPSNYDNHSIGATSTIEYYGGNQTVAVLNSGQNYGNLTISGAGTKTLAGNIGIAGNLSISNATLNLGTFTANRTTSGGTLALASGATLQVGGSSGGITGSNFPANFTTYTLSGTVEFTGTGPQTVPVLSYTHLIFTNGGTKSITASITATGDVTVNAGAPLVIASGVTFQVDGNFTNAGSVTNNGTVNVGN